MSSVIAGVGWDMVGAVAAATFYVPISKVKKWSWETTWAVAGVSSWLLVPIAVSFFLLPDFWAFYSALDTHVLLTTFLFGCMWGIGNVSYGLTMRYLGMSLGIGVAIGVTLATGTLIPPILHGQGGYLISTRSGLMTLAGVLVSLIGVAIVSLAGHLKEKQLGSALQQLHLKKGLMLAVMCGIFSAGMSFAIDAANPMTTAALKAGVQPLYAGLPCYVVIMAGGALVNLGYCFIRLAAKSDLSLKADWSQPGSANFKNAAMATAGGTVWYLQFFFLAWGKANIPPDLAYVNWMLLMSGYVLCGGLVGLALGEWNKVNARPIRLLWLGMIVIIAAANLVGLGMAL